MEGWIKLHRLILDWDWYSDANTFRLFIHLLLKANPEDNDWRGIKIKRGQRFTSIDSLSDELSLTPKQIRLSISKLIKTQEITTQGASNGTMITVCKYNTYQENQKRKGEPMGKQWANEGQTKGDKERIIRIKELKEYIKPFFDEKYILTSDKVFCDLLEIDKYTVEKIKEAISKGVNDDFWKQQFQSPNKLRTKNKAGVKYIDVFLSLNDKINNTDGTMTREGFRTNLSLSQRLTR